MAQGWCEVYGEDNAEYFLELNLLEKHTMFIGSFKVSISLSPPSP